MHHSTKTAATAVDSCRHQHTAGFGAADITHATLLTHSMLHTVTCHSNHCLQLSLIPHNTCQRTFHPILSARHITLLSGITSLKPSTKPLCLLHSRPPCSPELGELHNQAALLLLFGHQHDAAARHASDALDLTQKAFGPTHPLTGHRLLRLGTIRWDGQW